MRICIVYDCLYPWTVGGAERWYRNLADEFVRAGHEVVYATRRQWQPGEEPRIKGVDVIAVSPGGELYRAIGSRRIWPALRFGLGVFLHLARRRRAYDVVHVCASPIFGVLAARIALVGAPTVIGVDWHEVWTRDYWITYLGRLRGRVGYALQRLCVRATPHAFVFSQLHARRLDEEKLRRPAIRLAGEYTGGSKRIVTPQTEHTGHTVVFAGRLIPEKQAPAVVPAVAAARRQIPEMRGLILGDGPQRGAVLAAIEREGLVGVVEATGFVEPEAVQRALADALCLLQPSTREGYGLIVIEAAALGTPSIVVAGSDNAAVELIDDGVNGFVASSAEAQVLAEAIIRVEKGGAKLRVSTLEWFEREGSRLTASASAAAVLECYAQARL
ncbi:MAG: glycosyltransferase [Gaiellaceae bacterium]|jgi:glycosyltransferase involved in cell wall biosynthesis